MFKRVALTAAAGLAIVAPLAAAHTVTSKADCTSANFSFTLFGPTTLNTLNWSVNVDGKSQTGVTTFTGANGTLTVPLNISGSATVVAAVTGRMPDGFTVNYVSAPIPVSCPVPTQPQYSPNPPVTLPSPPVEVPVTPVPVKPKTPPSCATLRAHRAGKKTMKAYGCLIMIKHCPKNKVPYVTKWGDHVCRVNLRHIPVTGFKKN